MVEASQEKEEKKRHGTPYDMRLTPYDMRLTPYDMRLTPYD